MGAKSFRLLLLCLLIVALSGCRTRTSEEDAWLTVGDAQVMTGEVMVYLLQTYNDFEAYGGEDVWLIEDFSGGKSAEEVAVEGARQNLVKVKVLLPKAEEMGIVLDAEEEARLISESHGYFAGLDSSFVQESNITADLVFEVFKENYLADRVMSETMDSYTLNEEEIDAYILADPDYSRLAGMDVLDALTAYRLHVIVIRTHERDAAGQWQPLEPSVQKERAVLVQDIFEQLEKGADFVELVQAHSQTDYLGENPEGMEITKAQLTDIYREALASMAIGDYTGIIEGEFGYHILKLVAVENPTDEGIEQYKERFLAWEEALRAEARLELTKDAFEIIYQRWRSAVPVTYGSQWEGLDFLGTFKNHQ